ncbi:hypothetical protein [Bacillus sp. AM 13(2015)]|nr:hypothetical protein [Bacillus sp. AM 13(2015)]
MSSRYVDKLAPFNSILDSYWMCKSKTIDQVVIFIILFKVVEFIDLL